MRNAECSLTRASIRTRFDITARPAATHSLFSDPRFIVPGSRRFTLALPPYRMPLSRWQPVSGQSRGPPLPHPPSTRQGPDEGRPPQPLTNQTPVGNQTGAQPPSLLLGCRGEMIPASFEVWMTSSTFQIFRHTSHCAHCGSVIWHLFVTSQVRYWDQCVSFCLVLPSSATDLPGHHLHSQSRWRLRAASLDPHPIINLHPSRHLTCRSGRGTDWWIGSAPPLSEICGNAFCVQAPSFWGE